jgi:FkbM family methyltransferase
MKPGIVNSGRSLTFLSKYPADLIAGLAPGLIVDVGAATGETTLTARKANPASRVIAYEPFPGNLPYLERAVKDDPQVTVRPVAVSDFQGSGTLFLPSIIRERTRVAGSSRVGKLNPFPFRKAVAKVKVPVIRLDDEIREHVRFLKIDIQVGEFHVLNGARDLISQYGIDLIYVEFRGDLRLLRLLDQAGYTIIDCAYMAWPHRRYFRNLLRAKPDWKIPNWEVLRTGNLSTGHRSRHVWPRVPFRSFAGYCAWFYFERIFVTGLQTDLLCVHRSFQEEFEKLCRLINPDSSA